MLKHIKVPIIIDDHEPERCKQCEFLSADGPYCPMFQEYIQDYYRCQQCMEGAK